MLRHMGTAAEPRCDMRHKRDTWRGGIAGPGLKRGFTFDDGMGSGPDGPISDPDLADHGGCIGLSPWAPAAA